MSRDPAAISRLAPPHLGLDLEWDIKTETPTILGVSDGATTVSTHFNEGIPKVVGLLLSYPGAFDLEGHNVVRAERPLLAGRGVTFPLEKIQDSIIWHYLVNAHLCKAGGKATGEEDALSRRGPGFMNIYTMCSLHTSLPDWKHCREKECHGVPCPKHDVFWYNGLDALGPVLAIQDMKRKAQLIGVDGLYPMHVELNWTFHKMQERGVWVNKTYIDQMRADFHKAKLVMWGADQVKPTPESMPFNPRSHDQTIKYFREKYDIKLPDTKEETIRAFVMQYEPDENELEQDDEGNFSPKPTNRSDHPMPELVDLLSYKELGSGPDRWFAPRVWNGKDFDGYVIDEGNGYGSIHPSTNHFTSTSRTACAGPNMQNVEKRRIDRKTGENIGKRMRAAVVPPPGFRLYSADYSNGENRAFMYYAGYQIPEGLDLHDWMVGNIGLQKNDEFSISLGSPRDAAKSVSHASDYLEGLDLLSPQKLASPFIQREIRAGARLVFRDWKFKDYTVSFTGANLAQRAFHSKDWDSRKRALGIASRYLDQSFPKLRDVQKMIMKQVERGMVQTMHKYALQSYDRTPNDMVKTGVAMWGQSPIAHFLKLALNRAEAHPRIIPVLGVHDEIVFYSDVKYEPSQIKKDITDVMVFETPEMPGFSMPIKLKEGPNWRDMKTV